jgi:hypothetical protein
LGGGVGQVAAVGRNLSLFDPESAYRMMSVINTKEANYKAEYVVTSDLKVAVSDLQGVAKRLGTLDANATADEIRSGIESFAAAYDDWIRRFDGELRGAGILADSQAAKIAHWELRQSVEYYFHGAASGMHGMADLGLSIDPQTRLARFDPQRLEQALDTNRPGVLATLNEFSASFTRAAELLNSENNFIANRMTQLDRALSYVRDNIASLRTEFGQGDAADLYGRKAEAVTRYDRLQTS